MARGFPVGTKFSDETRAKMSAAQKGKSPSAETREKLSAALIGRIRPDQRQDFCKRGHDMNLPNSRHPKQGHCMACRHITELKSRNAPHRKAAIKAYMSGYSRRKLYGITELDYARMFVEQNGVCAICKEKDSSGKQLAVDHDHETGKIRALLCHGCNLTLGKVKDSVALLEAMITYLKEHGQNTVIIN
jgi:plasmid stability protein